MPANTAQQQIAYSPKDVERLTGLGRNTVYTAIAEGRIPSVRVGKRILIPRAALERLINGEAN